MLVKVTQEMIDSVQTNDRFSPTDCLGATILKPLFPGQRILCGYNDVNVGYDNVKHILPDILIEKIGDYINGREVTPFEFELDI